MHLELIIEWYVNVVSRFQMVIAFWVIDVVPPFFELQSIYVDVKRLKELGVLDNYHQKFPLEKTNSF